MFAEKVNELIKALILPFYRSIIWFYAPAIDPKYLSNIKEEIIIEIT